jgi:hypothetical protein
MADGLQPMARVDLIDFAETATGQDNRVSPVPFYSAGVHIADDNPAGFAFDHHQVYHLIRSKKLHPSGGHLTPQSLVSAQEQLLTRLTSGIKGS